MTRKLLSGLLALTLIGAGCPLTPEPEVPVYVPGEMPTEAQLEIMTDEEKMAGMEAMLEAEPMDEMNREEQAGEVNKSIMMLRDGTSIRHGVFEGRFLHPADGSVRVVEEDGKHYLVFSNEFSVLPGPALYVYLSSETRPGNADNVIQEGFEIAKLKSSKGVQTYELPEGVNFDDIHSVVIVCKPFKFIFASAEF